MRKAALATLVAAIALISTTAPAQTYGGPITPLPVPDGIGTCTPGPTVTDTSVVVPTYGSGIASITVSVAMAHTWYGDLNVKLTSPLGTTVHLLGFACAGVGDPSDLAGLYTFDDAAAVTFDAAAAATTLAVPVGSYRGDNPLAPFLCEDPTGTW